MSLPQKISFPLDGHLPLVEGDTWRGATFTVKQDGQGLNLTGAEINIDFHQGLRKTLSLSTTNGSIIWINQAAGTFTIKSLVLNLSVGQHISDLQITDANGIKTTYCQIVLNITKEYTKA